MYLKALELQGFKSFPDKTRITFEKDVTAIVGPNGSGKSNISDAILWVMGEQRSKTLRGGKMEDVIFGGTEKRGALGFAQVSLIIDNTEHIFDCDSTELMLTRRYYRSGESEYYINREAVRLKDINSLLMDTGLGRDGYSIIGQGKIAEIVSTKSSDRREVFEEAAGISRYRSRKEESERKLEKTEENLLRINDKIDELELQIEPLRRQSETAKKYLVLRDELRVREISVWMATLDKLHAQAQVINADYETAKSELDEAHRSLEALYASAGSISERMHEKDIEADKARERLSQTEAKAADCDSRAAVLRANIKSSGESVERMKSDIAGAQARLSEIARQIDDNGAKADELAGRIAELSAKETGSSNVIEGCRMKLQSRENAAAQLREKVNRLSVDCRSMDARIHMLSEMEKEYEGFSKAVKTVMRESGRGNLRGVHGPVANLIKTDNEYALAVETALGAAMQNIVIDTQNDGRSAIEMLKRLDSGRATFLPVDTVRGNIMKDAPVNDPGFVGIAYDLVSFDKRYDSIFANLLGRTVVAETLADAVRMSKANGNRLRIVSLDGQLINAGGSMTGGSAARGTGILSRANELEELKKRRLTLGRQYDAAQIELEKSVNALSGLRYELDAAVEERAEIQRDKASCEAEKRATNAAIEQLKVLSQSLSGDSEQRRAAIEKAQSACEEIKSQLDAVLKQRDDILGQAEKIKAEIAEINAKRLNKYDFAKFLAKNDGFALDPDAILDVQVKRLHEYKRQLLCAMLITRLQMRIHEEPNADFMPCTFVFGAKAAAGYYTAKRIIELICSLADDISRDPLCKGKLQVCFMENYRVSAAEALMPAAQVSEQISTAGKEASGTGNMKLMLNGAVTIGTLDGANVEMYERLGDKNMFLFGLKTDEVTALKASGYDPQRYAREDAELGAVLDRISRGFADGKSYSDLVSNLLYNGDPYMLCADFRDYVNTHDRMYSVISDPAERARLSIINTAEAGIFAADRAIKEYAEDIWGIKL